MVVENYYTNAIELNGHNPQTVQDTTETKLLKGENTTTILLQGYEV